MTITTRRPVVLLIALLATIASLTLLAQEATAVVGDPVARIGAATYESIQDAVDAANPGDVIVPVERWRILAESVDVDGKSVVLEGFILSPASGMAVRDTDSGDVPDATMQNVTVLRGGVDEVIAQNCVLFRSSSTFSTMSVTDSIVRNCIVESGADSTGSSFTTSLLTWTQEDNGFVHLAGGDSHILPDATDAIDSGSDLAGPGSSQDFDGNTRAAGEADIGIDELHPEFVARRESVELYQTTGFFYLGAGRGSVSVSNEFGYVVGASVGTTTADTLYVLRFDSTSVQTVGSIQAAGAILDVAHVVDNTTLDASWRAWVFLVVDTDADGHGDSIQMVIDEGDGGLSHPTGSLTDADPTNRGFGDVAVGGALVYRPRASSTDYRIARIIVDALIDEGDVDPADPEYDSPSGTNRAKWLRLFFSAFNTSAAGGALFKVNADPYDSTEGPSSNNDAFGSTIWEIEAGTHDFDYLAPMAFTTSTKKLLVPVSNSVAPAQTVLARFPMIGLSAPLVELEWRAQEEAFSVDENRFGASLNTGASSTRVTYAVSDGTVVYNRDIESTSTSAAAWTSRLPATPSVQPVRSSPYPFTLVAVEGAVHKIWSSDSDNDTRNGALAATGLKVVLDQDQIVNESFESGARTPIGHWRRWGRRWAGSGPGRPACSGPLTRTPSTIGRGIVRATPSGRRVTRPTPQARPT